jgi:RNase P/RNase MRP subunit p29
MTDRTGQRVRIILIGDRFYSGLVLEETETTLTIRDKFGSEVSIGKNALISLEVLD